MDFISVLLILFKLYLFLLLVLLLSEKKNAFSFEFYGIFINLWFTYRDSSYIKAVLIKEIFEKKLKNYKLRQFSQTKKKNWDCLNKKSFIQ